MLTIRLRRMGKRDQAFYRFVVSDSRKAPTASAVEEVGHYNPRTEPPEIRVDRERIDYWVGNGATLSNTVKTLVKRAEAAAAAGDTAEGDEGAEAAKPAKAKKTKKAEEAPKAKTAKKADKPEKTKKAESKKAESKEAKEAKDADKAEKSDEAGEAAEGASDAEAEASTEDEGEKSA